jgi:putative oxidoreductase
MLKLLKLSFLPWSPDFGLLIMRVTIGFSMLLLHGREKLMNFAVTAEKMDGLFLSLPGNVNAGLAVFAELFCSALLIAGFLTRFAALMLCVTMGTALFIVHKSALVGERNGELAMVYLVAYVTLLFTGAGKISVDRE